MPTTITCPSCGMDVPTSSGMPGTRGVCPSCTGPIAFPANAPSPFGEQMPFNQLRAVPQAIPPTAQAIRPTVPASREQGELTGKRLGGLVLQEKLGGGGFGSVYLGRPDVGPARAVKVLHDAGLVGQLRREAEHLLALKHSRIVELVYADLTNDPPYMVMELVSNGTLSERLPMTPDAALPVLRGILEGLACAHERGVAHLDLKPKNILMAGATPKIADFGLARASERARADVRNSQSGSSIGDMSSTGGKGGIQGTLAYMAPEQREGKPGDARSDIYSFGMLVCQTLTGKLPEAGDTLEGLMGTTPPTWAQAMFAGSYCRYEKRFANAGTALEVLNRLAVPPPSDIPTFPLVAEVPTFPLVDAAPRPIVAVPATAVAMAPTLPRKKNAMFCRNCATQLSDRAEMCVRCGMRPLAGDSFCQDCGSSTPQVGQQICGKCGVRLGLGAPGAVPYVSNVGPGNPPQNKVVCALLAFLLPYGIHRFIMGYTTEGILQLVLSCLFVGIIWSWIDGIMILTGSLKMADGRDLI